MSASSNSRCSEELDNRFQASGNAKCIHVGGKVEYYEEVHYFIPEDAAICA
jgi:hypothetical protein